MNETERILRIILKIVRGPLTVRELTGFYTVITGTSIPHEDLGYWILTDYLMTIPHILSLERRFNDFDGIVIPNEPEEDNISGTNSFSSYETLPELIRQTSLSQDVDNTVDQENNETVGQSDKEDEEQPFNNHSTDSYIIDDKLWDTIESQDYYWKNDYSIVKKKNWHPPSDIVDLDYKIQRDSISCDIGNFISVVVDHVYDPSKFWLRKDDGRLHSLTEAMFTFYEKKRDEYLIPKTYTDIGRYCVAFRMNQYYRCVIVKKESVSCYVNVFFIDYGTLGRIPKDQIWFLTKDFSRLPAQAIRARLGNIYPPREDTPWSLEAIYRFHSLVNAQLFEARVDNISNGVAEVCLLSSSNEYINSILVNERLALFTDQAQKRCLRYIHCLPKYRSVHLFPDFREIEQWIVPSVEDIEYFLNSHLTAEFYLSHCFWRPVNLDEQKRDKMKILMRRQQKKVEFIQSLEKMHRMQEIMDYTLEDLWHDYNESLIQFEQDPEFVDTPAESDNLSTLAE